jgi:hypothetical protein
MVSPVLSMIFGMGIFRSPFRRCNVVGDRSGERIDNPDRITITEWHRWGLDENQMSCGITIEIKTWDDFLSIYNEKRSYTYTSMN